MSSAEVTRCPVDELRLVAEPLQHLGDLRPAPVDDHRPQPRRLQQHHVLREAALQVGIGHGGAAVLDHRRACPENFWM
jgi:hypothetical protein